MKRILLILFTLFFTTGLIAQDYKEIKTNQLPKKVNEYLKKNLGTYTLGRAATYTEKGVVKYAVAADTRGRKAVYVFDKDGNFLERTQSLKPKETPKPATPPPPSGKKVDDKSEPVKK